MMRHLTKFIPSTEEQAPKTSLIQMPVLHNNTQK